MEGLTIDQIAAKVVAGEVTLAAARKFLAQRQAEKLDKKIAAAQQA